MHVRSQTSCLHTRSSNSTWQARFTPPAASRCCNRVYQASAKGARRVSVSRWTVIATCRWTKASRE
ncbi:hypothetical protein BAUCODRAFT_388564 [Baudoinia panamericana UAMH 10762]|uniref:Uncharacterized protein n=1 Tax=Baudoinia panamericana (strain UAMH 10762) TaxID=717646 RepID=M2NIW4_BAUPA|nr:uncharacterized protein BAUCODRAFT_388564 [Baudoinia panamericana UAMH 10762]EMC99025.1 hypothetical protein BAUCODRAFT_388564 [Baudoinia panamericana UAMH 10762]